MTTPSAGDNSNPELIISTYKSMTNECQQLTTKISELTMEKEEHRLVLETLKKLEPERKTFRLLNGVLVEHSVGEVTPTVEENFEGIVKLIDVVNETLSKKEKERKKFKDEHGIMTQEEREAIMRAKSKEGN
jgi:prefoldin subunit 2